MQLPAIGGVAARQLHPLQLQCTLRQYSPAARGIQAHQTLSARLPSQWLPSCIQGRRSAAPLAARSPARRRRQLVCTAGPGDSQPTDVGAPERLITSVGLGLLWAAVLYYAFALAPGQTPYRDKYFIEKLVGLGENDGVQLNAVFTQLFTIMGVYPVIYASLLLPAGRSGNKIPAWPFVTASFAAGVFALLPYFALWDAPKEKLELPPKKEDLGKIESVLESQWNAALLLVGSVVLWGLALTAGGPAWSEYSHLIDESKLVHVTTLDFMLLSAFAPFWMWNDAQLRNWGPRDKVLPILSVLPVVGPALYLLLRPKAQ